MKATIFEIKRFAVHDGDGIRTTVFFKGCSLKCVWCHNPEGLGASPQLGYYEHKCTGCGECAAVCPANAHRTESGIHVFDREKCIACGRCAVVCTNGALSFYGKEVTVEELLSLLLEDREFYEESDGGVTLSGGECLMQADFCAELLKRLKEHGIHTAVDTCGFVSRETLDRVIPFTDVFLYDIKAYDEEVHKKCTGVSNRRILDNLAYLDSVGKSVEIRIPYVPDHNDAEMRDIARFVSTLKNVTKIRVLPYHAYAGSKYRALDMENTLPERLPSSTELDEAKAIIRKLTSIRVQD
ncbi:MAG: glycyl-radical enzyme activating protein [Clostridia bacterium]|nr:glycyl-radical enzyme activating protein [Clostridia bacterium]